MTDTPALTTADVTVTRRQRITVVAYEGFDPVTDEDVLLEHLVNRYGDGWQMGDFDPETRVVSASRPVAARVIDKPTRFEIVEPAPEPAVQ